MPSSHAKAILSDPSLKGVLPSSFLYACSSASYQIEGGYDADGKGLGVWDAFFKGKEDTGEVACDSYHLWKEDIKLLKEYGCNSYRFSIAWPRIIPNGEYDHFY
jgi:beta-glucosidase/6-phospho-beta-glucosidase/beta-galactosidase